MKHKIKMPSTKKSFFKKFSFVFRSLGVILFICLGVILMLTPTPLFSSTKAKKNSLSAELIEKEDQIITEKTNVYYNKGHYLKAVEEINISIERHQQEKDLPDNIQLMAEASYYAWISSLYKNSKTLNPNTYNKVINYLILHPEVVSSRIENLTEEIYQNEKILFEKERIKNVEKNNNIGLEKTLNKIYKIQQSKKSLDEVIAGTKTVKDIRRAFEIEQEFKKNQIIKYLMISLYCLIFFAIITLILIIRNNHKKLIEAQIQFETTMKVVAILKQDSNTESPYNPLCSTDSTKELGKTKVRRKIGLSDFESEQIAVEYFSNENAKKDFLTLQNKCIELGERIDRATGRKRNSKKVSELVFKLCKVASVDDELALIYYCCAMVYDAGFLAISRSILQGEHLTIKERYEVRSHVQKAKEYYDFIPENVKRIFLDAAEFHHENFDGKGYLAGLSGTKIPLIARFIRVAESYVSLVNSRSYKKIMDSVSALNELKKKNGIYDSKIITLLEKVI